MLMLLGTTIPKAMIGKGWLDPSLRGDADVESLKLLGVCSPKPRHRFT